MKPNSKLITVIIILLLLLFFRDAPYVNIFVVNRIWIFYLLIVLYLLPIRSIVIFYVAAAVLLVLSFLFTFLSFPMGAEILGIIMYMCLWVIGIYTVYGIFRSR